MAVPGAVERCRTYVTVRYVSVRLHRASVSMDDGCAGVAVMRRSGYREIGRAM